MKLKEDAHEAETLDTDGRRMWLAFAGLNGRLPLQITVKQRLTLWAGAAMSDASFADGE